MYIKKKKEKKLLKRFTKLFLRACILNVEYELRRVMRLGLESASVESTTFV